MNFMTVDNMNYDRQKQWPIIRSNVKYGSKEWENIQCTTVEFILDDLCEAGEYLRVVVCLSVTNLIPSRTHLDFMQIFVIPS